MSDSSSLHENVEIDGCDMTPSSQHSQESGLGTMLVHDGSSDSLAELSVNVHQQLNAHFDHMGLMQYEMELLRAQLNEKDRIISVQQTTVKKLQDAISSSYGELLDMRRNSEVEVDNKNETIRILQSELAECQKQYANCFEKVVNQDRLLTEIRDDDTMMLEKISLLENHLRKTRREVGTQTEFESNQSNRKSHASLSDREHLRQAVDKLSVSLQNWSFNPATSDNCTSTPKPSRRENVHAQEPLIGSQQPQQRTQVNSSGVLGAPFSNERTRLDDFQDFWNIITDEKQQRSKLEHTIRQMETELMDLKNQVQNCSAQLQLQPKGGCYVYQSEQNPCCCHIAHCLSCESTPVVNRSSSFVTLV